MRKGEKWAERGSGWNWRKKGGVWGNSLNSHSNVNMGRTGKGGKNNRGSKSKTGGPFMTIKVGRKRGIKFKRRRKEVIVCMVWDGGRSERWWFFEVFGRKKEL